MTEGKIRLKNVSVGFSNPRPFFAVKDLSFSVKAGEFVCLLGPSGCGKSTTLHTIAGLVEPAGGEAVVGGQKVSSPSEDVLMVFQQPHLFPWLNVAENIGFFLRVNKTEKTRKAALVDYYLNLISLKNFADFYPHQLSVGMQQRVSIARTLAAEPEIILMDEPFRAVDYQKRMELHEFVLNALKKLGKTIIFATHDVEEAIVLADRILVMTESPGRIKKEIVIDFGNERADKPTTRKKFLDYKQAVLESLRY